MMRSPKWVELERWLGRWRGRRWPLAVGLVLTMAGLVAATSPAGSTASTSAVMSVGTSVATPPTSDGHPGPALSPPLLAAPSPATPPAVRPVLPASPDTGGSTRPSPTQSTGAGNRPTSPSPSATVPPASPTVSPGQGGSGEAPASNPYGADEVTYGWTPRTQYVVDQIEARFPVRGCGGEAEGTTSGHVVGSDHYSGNAADCFATSPGTIATGSDRDLGDAVAAWVVRNAAALKVKYVIWYARIYDLETSNPSWQPYCNSELSASECANPTPGDVATNQHYDHVHISLFH